MAGVNVMEYRKVVFLKESASNASAREVGGTKSGCREVVSVGQQAPW